MDSNVAHPGTSRWSLLDLVGIFVFALTGALVAVRKELDVFAVLVLAGVAGLGGGFLRDVLIGAPYRRPHWRTGATGWSPPRQAW